MITRVRMLTLSLPLAALLAFGAMPDAQQAAGVPPTAPGTSSFVTADTCQACHNGLVSPRGEHISIGVEWRASMMANAARDPYWQAGVRREVLDHPAAAAAIEHECSACHMPMTRYDAKAAGGRGQVFAHLPVGAHDSPASLLAADGVSCSLCHQLANVRLGQKETFTANFTIQSATPRRAFGPHVVDAGRARVMRSATGFQPAEGSHIQRAEICASCHTLYTHALTRTGEPAGELPEQVPYLEWLHSAYRSEKSCQDCHMPAVAEPTPISSVLGADQPRPHVSRHEFRGGNFFMPRVLNRFRQELGVAAQEQDLSATAQHAVEYLEHSAATLALPAVTVDGSRLMARLEVTNLAGHKLPTAYPSRRAWIHLVVKGGDGRVLFESGRLAADGSIVGNDNDEAAGRFEPHHLLITTPGQVQVYEAIMADHEGAVTTGLIAAVRYLKDNRLLPRGFDKTTAPADVAVRGEAAGDPDFGTTDNVQYVVDTGGDRGPFTVEAELWYQPVGHRWAQNLRLQPAFETTRFLSYWNAMGPWSAVRLARAVAIGRPAPPIPPTTRSGGR